ncbi:MAG: hypothetical protein MJ211_10345 [Bacteroidales bacterium]|nr:hypothetical protein [Bacteroidales bacterium]
MKTTKLINSVPLLITAFLIYSSSLIGIKYASFYQVFSWQFFLIYAFIVIAMAIYAVLWQKILSVVDLNCAFLCKSSTIFFVSLFSYLLFSESISVKNIIGIIFIISGLTALVWKR